MDTIFISESFRRGHELPEIFEKGTIKALGSTGNLGDDDGVAYYDTSNFKKLISKFNGKINGIVYGTDFDTQGTKVASIYKLSAEALGIQKNIRMAFTKDGYMKIGEFYPKERLEVLLRSDKFNQITYHSLKEEKIYAGYKTSTIIGKVKSLKSSGYTVKVKNSGTNTITYLTKAMMSGTSCRQAYNKLIGAYEKGVIEYPRVDSDYHLEDNYDLYAHPKLKEFDEFSTPIDAEELPLNKQTVLLALSNERLITPSMALSYYEKIDMYFDDDLNVRKGKEKEVSIMEKISHSFEDVVRTEMKMAHNPNLAMVRRPIPPMKSNSEKEKRKLMEYAWELQRKLEEEMRKRRKERAEEEWNRKMAKSIVELENTAEGEYEKHIFRKSFSIKR